MTPRQKQAIGSAIETMEIRRDQYDAMGNDEDPCPERYEIDREEANIMIDIFDREIAVLKEL